jgi:serine/threonine protein kinase
MEKFLKNPSNNNKKEMTEEEYFKDSLCNSSYVLSNMENLNLKDKFDLTIISEYKNFKKNDFEILSELGRGSYSKVLKAKLIKEDKLKAIKIMDRDFMERENKLYQVYLEANLLYKINHPFIIKCEGIFSSGRKIHLVLDYVENSDFSEFLKINSKTFLTIFFNKKII